MIRKTTIIGSLASLGILLAMTSSAIATPNSHENHPLPMQQTGQFQPIEQPLSYKILVTLSGLGLMGLELWWFLFSKPKPQQVVISSTGIQEITITVDGGYEPSHIMAQVGQTLRLNFHRQDPSNCLEEVRFPDFHITQKLPLHQITLIELLPDKPGKYEFACGMNMFRGSIEVQSPNPAANP